MQTVRREEACLLELRSRQRRQGGKRAQRRCECLGVRRLCEKDEKLAQLDEEAAEQRCKAAEHRVSFEERSGRKRQRERERVSRYHTSTVVPCF